MFQADQPELILRGLWPAPAAAADVAAPASAATAETTQTANHILTQLAKTRLSAELLQPGELVSGMLLQVCRFGPGRGAGGGVMMSLLHVAQQQDAWLPVARPAAPPPLTPFANPPATSPPEPRHPSRWRTSQRWQPRCQSS